MVKGEPAEPEPECFARDWSVRGLPLPDSSLRATADRLGVPVYSGVDAALNAGLPIAPRWERVTGWRPW